MQTFSRVQRNFTDKKYLKYILLALLFIYNNIAMIYIYMPQLLGIYFLLFSYYLSQREEREFTLLFVLFLMSVEANRDFPIFSVVIYFIVLKKMIMPMVEYLVSCEECKDYIEVVLVYGGLYVFLNLIYFIFLEHSIELDALFFFYFMLIDLFFVMVYAKS